VFNKKLLGLSFATTVLTYGCALSRLRFACFFSIHSGAHLSFIEYNGSDPPVVTVHSNILRFVGVGERRMPYVIEKYTQRAEFP
jgi:hypothetical protein